VLPIDKLKKPAVARLSHGLKRAPVTRAAYAALPLQKITTGSLFDKQTTLGGS
jgi:hypothetical protein